MNTPLYQNKIIVKKSSIHGYGVFAGKSFRTGEKIEVCYFVLTDSEDDVVVDYLFEAGKRSALIFGYGSLYNHSEFPNVAYKLNLKQKLATFKASRPIKKGEELFVSYGDEWFSSRDAIEK